MNLSRARLTTEITSGPQWIVSLSMSTRKLIATRGFSLILFYTLKF